jgi:hypothetical protein
VALRCTPSCHNNAPSLIGPHLSHVHELDLIASLVPIISTPQCTSTEQSITKPVRGSQTAITMRMHSTIELEFNDQNNRSICSNFPALRLHVRRWIASRRRSAMLASAILQFAILPIPRTLGILYTVPRTPTGATFRRQQRQRTQNTFRSAVHVMKRIRYEYLLCTHRHCRRTEFTARTGIQVSNRVELSH